MVGLKEICALLLAGGIGATSVVAVQEVKKPKTHVSKAKAKAKAKAKTKAKAKAKAKTEIKYVPIRAYPYQKLMPSRSLDDCIFIPRTPDFALQPLPDLSSNYFTAPSTYPPRNFWPLPPTTRLVPSPAAVPQPDTWVMLVTGFGLLGLAMRKSQSGAEKAVHMPADPQIPS